MRETRGSLRHAAAQALRTMRRSGIVEAGVMPRRVAIILGRLLVGAGPSHAQPALRLRCLNLADLLNESSVAVLVLVVADTKSKEFAFSDELSARLGEAQPVVLPPEDRT